VQHLQRDDGSGFGGRVGVLDLRLEVERSKRLVHNRVTSLGMVFVAWQYLTPCFARGPERFFHVLISLLLWRNAVLFARCLTSHLDPGTFHPEGERHLSRKALLWLIRESFSVRNLRIEVYDKTKEMLVSGKTIPKGIAKKKTPLVRFEWRAKGARTVRNHFNLSSAEDLIKRLNIISRRFFYNNITFPIIYGLNLVDLYHCLYKPTWIWFFVDILIGSIKEAIIAVLYLKVPP
jgi:hypothetical protein